MAPTMSHMLGIIWPTWGSDRIIAPSPADRAAETATELLPDRLIPWSRSNKAAVVKLTSLLAPAASARGQT